MFLGAYTPYAVLTVANPIPGLPLHTAVLQPQRGANGVRAANSRRSNADSSVPVHPTGQRSPRDHHAPPYRFTNGNATKPPNGPHQFP